MKVRKDASKLDSFFLNLSIGITDEEIVLDDDQEDDQG